MGLQFDGYTHWPWIATLWPMLLLGCIMSAISFYSFYYCVKKWREPAVEPEPIVKLNDGSTEIKKPFYPSKSKSFLIDDKIELYAIWVFILVNGFTLSIFLSSILLS